MQTEPILPPLQAVFRAVDMATDDSYGNPTALTIRADQSALLAADEGFYVSGSDITVKPIRAGAPDSDLLVIVVKSDFLVWRSQKVSFSELSWMGQNIYNNPANVGMTLEWWTNNALFGYGNSTATCFAIGGTTNAISSTAYINNTDVAYPGADGLSSNTNVTFVCENRCNCYKAGSLVTASSQNSTSHTGSQTARILGNYLDTYGTDDLADTGTGANAWNYKCSAGNVHKEDGVTFWYDSCDIVSESGSGTPTRYTYETPGISGTPYTPTYTP